MVQLQQHLTGSRFSCSCDEGQVDVACKGEGNGGAGKGDWQPEGNWGRLIGARKKKGKRTGEGLGEHSGLFGSTGDVQCQGYEAAMQ
jgi:hypothetical protein